jgi:glycerol-3-phosphate dehydrogenase (NAD(P)+)
MPVSSPSTDGAPPSEIIAVLGGGAMGTACASILAHKGIHEIRLWVRNEDFAAHIDATRENTRLLPGVRLPETIRVTSDPGLALRDSTIVMVCVPTKGIRAACSTVGTLIPADALLVSAVKGIETNTLIRPSEMLQDLLGTRPVVVLGGPCHAEELARRLPTSVVAACQDLKQAERVQDAFSSETFRVYSNADQCGVELGGALKNVIAIAAGICDGLELGDNAKSALITRGLAEMTRFCEAMNVLPDTLSGLAGVGDLVATCGSRHSRNRRVGELLGQGKSLAQIEASMEAVAEGVLTARSVHTIAEQKHIDMPIADTLCRVLFQEHSARDATVDLMNRPLRSE